MDTITMSDFRGLLERSELRRQRIILLSGEIDDITAHEFIEDMAILINSSKDPITIIITSPGGSAFAGLAIIRSIRHAQSLGIVVNGEVYGQAMSMAFFILQCCDNRLMGELCILMAHGVTTGFVGDMRNVDAEQKLMKLWQKELSRLVAERCSAKGSEVCTHEFWTEIMQDNTPQFYSAKESLEMGLIDKICDINKRKETKS